MISDNTNATAFGSTTTNFRASSRRVDHTYRDYSLFPSDRLPNGKRGSTNFPAKLHRILSNPDEYSHVRHSLQSNTSSYQSMPSSIFSPSSYTNQCPHPFFYLNLLNPPNCYLLNPRNLSQIIAWMVRRLKYRSDGSKPVRLLTFASSTTLSTQPHGRAWKIQDKDESFTRQVNGWGFKKLHQLGNDYNAYYHEQFLRGLPHLTPLMRRVPQNQGKLLPFVEGEPNFYEIDKHYPLVRQPKMMIPSNQGQQSHNMGGGGNNGAPQVHGTNMMYPMAGNFTSLQLAAVFIHPRTHHLKNTLYNTAISSPCNTANSSMHKILTSTPCSPVLHTLQLNLAMLNENYGWYLILTRATMHRAIAPLLRLKLTKVTR